jgi:hypothetical protein
MDVLSFCDDVPAVTRSLVIALKASQVKGSRRYPQISWKFLGISPSAENWKSRIRG